MNRFKKIMLGALSVLTLGLFVVTGTKVNAATTDYYYWKNVSNSASNSTKLINSNDDTITLTGFTNSSTDSGRASTITTSLLPNGAAIASGDRALKVSSGSNGTFTPTVDCNFKAIVLYDSKSAGNIYFKQGTTELAHIETPKVSSKTSYELSYDGCMAGTEYTVTGASNLYFFEIVLEYEIPDYTIVYNNGEHGSSRDSASNVTTLSSELLAGLADDGDWTFDGWYLDNEYGTAASTSTVLSSYADSNGNVTLYAKWANSAAKYTVTFNSNEGSTVSPVDIFYDENGEATLGNNMPANPTKTGYRFAGWYTSGDVRVLASTVLKADTTLYAKWVAGSSTNVFIDSLTTEEYEALPSDGNTGWNNNQNIALNDSIDCVSLGNAWDGAYKDPDTQLVKSCEYSAKGTSSKTFSDSTTLLRYVQCQNVYLTLTKTTKVTIYATQTGSQDKHNRNLVVLNGSNEILGYYLMTKNNVSGPEAYSIVLSAGTYNLKSYANDNSGAEGFANFYGVKLDEFTATPSVVFNCQYDTKDPSQATKIRFIATMDGIVDPLLIDSITFTATVGGVTKEFKCTQLYSSLSNKYSELGSGDGRYYASYAIRNIQSAITSGASFTSLSVTVKFIAASGLESITANHAGFTIGTTGA